MASARVTLADAVERRLPLVSVTSGRPADGYLGVPVGLGFVERIVWSVTQRSAGRPVVRMPLTAAEFERVVRLWRAERSGVTGALAFAALAVALARFPLLLPLGVAICALSVLLVVCARWSLARAIPDVSIDGAQVTLRGVHREFASSVERGLRRYNRP